jgi:glycosyltransferase involved in cell wall biosynthesis
MAGRLLKGGELARWSNADEGSTPTLILATLLRPEGTTGVHTHLREFRRFLSLHDVSADVVTPFSWARHFTVPVFGIRIPLERLSTEASVRWYRHWHEVFLERALRKRLRSFDKAIVYAQGPSEARAALAARQGPHQRVVMAVHFCRSHADEWVRKGAITSESRTFCSIRSMERAVIPRVDGVVFVSDAARNDLVEWLPEAAAPPSVIIPNFVTSRPARPAEAPDRDLVTVGALEWRKNHRFLFQVLQECNRRGRRLTLDVYGDGPKRKELEDLCEQLDIGQQVRFCGFRSDVETVLGRYRAYVHASLFETGPYAVIEAMAAGVPVVTGRRGSFADEGDGSEGVRLWSLEDSEEATTTLLELLSDGRSVTAAGGDARRQFHERFDAEVLGPRLLSFLNSGSVRSSRARAAPTPLPQVTPPLGSAATPNAAPPVRGRSALVRKARHLTGNATIRLGIPPRWSRVLPNPTEPESLRQFSLFAVITTWNEADVIASTVSNAFSQGCERVYLLDNNSSDETVTTATAAGAELGTVFSTDYHDEMRRIDEVNALMSRVVSSFDGQYIWWLLLDADEFPHGPSGLTIHEYLATLDQRFRVVGARVFDHYPSGPLAHVPGYHPLDFQPLCQEVGIASCALRHWKHPLMRWDRSGSAIAASDGFHKALSDTRITEPDPGIFMHHFQYRQPEVTFERLRMLCEGRDEGTSRMTLEHTRTGRETNAQRRYSMLQSVYSRDWAHVDRPVMRGHSEGVQPVPWPHQVAAKDAPVKRWYVGQAPSPRQASGEGQNVLDFSST